MSMTGLAIVTVLIAAGAPVPETPRVQNAGNVERYQAETFARLVDLLALQVKDMSPRKG